MGFIQKKGERERILHLRDVSGKWLYNLCWSHEGEESCGLWHTALSSACIGSGSTMFELSGAISPFNRAYFKLS